ncbi:hypothetical protein ACRAWF_16940, partial [Streptomyces sp. L7]
FERTGEIDVATEPHQAEELHDWHAELASMGLADGTEFLDAEAVRERGRLADLPRRPLRQPGRRDAQPGQTGLGAEARLPPTSASVSTNTPPPSPSSRTARAWPYAPRTARSAPAASRSAPTSSRT